MMGKCEVCDNQGLVHVHHIIERRNNGENIPENLITLCLLCHDAITFNVKDPEYYNSEKFSFIDIRISLYPESYIEKASGRIYRLINYAKHIAKYRGFNAKVFWCSSCHSYHCSTEKSKDKVGEYIFIGKQDEKVFTKKDRNKHFNWRRYV